MTQDCVFCSIASKSIASDILSETDTIMVIRDIMPKAPVHYLVVTKQHIPSVNDLTTANGSLIAEMVLAAKTHASEAGVAETGYKLVWNIGKDGGQVIPHLHLHVLGGKPLGE